MGVSEKDIQLRYQNNYGHKGQGTLFDFGKYDKALYTQQVP